MSFPGFTAEAALQSSAATYTLRANRELDPSRIVMACLGTECRGTTESCCCPSKCVVTGIGCHCDEAMLRSELPERRAQLSGSAVSGHLC